MVQALDSQREAPIYNIKAVTHTTGVPSDTLRRWESRYSVITPQRTPSGYRLYSQRDIDIILWLKGKLDEGMSISSACEMLRQMGGDPGQPPLLTPTPSAPKGLVARPSASQSDLRSFDALQADLLDAFRRVDEQSAGVALTDALSLYSVEDVCLKLVQPTLVAVGQEWQDGEISVAVEHFASSFMRVRLENLFHASPHNFDGPLVLVGCAPNELHELGAMFLSVFLRRSGYKVVYLGQNVPLDSLTGMISYLKPQAVCISATRAETADALYSLRVFLDKLQEREGYAPLLAYGGNVFNLSPPITERIGGLYLGEDARAAVHALDERLRHYTV